MGSEKKMFSENIKIRVFLLIIKKSHITLLALLLLSLPIFFTSCSELEKPKPETFYSETKPPRKQEFRWSNGKMPKSFDPALAAAPPETDIVRAIYDGLTETESKTFKAVPAIAKEWRSSKDNKTWTFKLRRNAKWSNGEEITAKYFADSWKRLAQMGKEVKHYELLKNIVGVEFEPVKSNTDAVTKEKDSQERTEKDTSIKDQKQKSLSKSKEVLFHKPPKRETANSEASIELSEKKTSKEYPNNSKPQKDIGVKAISEYELQVSLKNPDKEFPKLVSHPIFRPVYNAGKEFENKKLSKDIVTSGAFLVESIGDDGIVIERAEHYWNRQKVKLKRVRFVPAKDADSALKAYREGKVDAVTNVQFEPLALKLLTPFYDFHRTTHSALNFYEFNRQKAPFNDRRVREALAISINRERLTEDELDGATKPAFNFLPYKAEKQEVKFAQNVKKAKDFMAQAGFSKGENFPKIRLVINRNNVQQRVAKSVAKMWKQHLNVETEIVLKEPEELDEAKVSGDFDLLRRGVVLPTYDETANMLAIFKPVKRKRSKNSEKKEAKKKDDSPEKNKTQETDKKTSGKSDDEVSSSELSKHDIDVTEEASELIVEVGEDDFILTEEEAIIEVPAIPLYFPTSYSLIKPYVLGFEMNILDAPSLKEVQIDSNWKPSKIKDES